jgi:hypothetical protein
MVYHGDSISTPRSFRLGFLGPMKGQHFVTLSIYIVSYRRQAITAVGIYHDLIF